MCVQHQVDAQTSWPQYSPKQFLCDQHQVILKAREHIKPELRSAKRASLLAITEPPAPQMSELAMEPPRNY